MAARQMQSAAQIEAASRARAEGTQQARTTQSPLVQRSAMLAELLKQGQEPPQRIAGYGDLAVRLLSQGLLSAAKSKTDKAVSAEAYNADLERRRRLAAAIPGVTVQGEPQEVGNGRLGNPLAGLANMLRGGGQSQPPPPPPPAAPPVPGQGQPPMAAPPPPMPTVTNTQNPVESPVAPVGPVQGQPMPPVGQPPAAPDPMAPPQAPMPQAMPQQPPAAPQAPPNPLGPTPGEVQLIQQYLNSGDPGEEAMAQQLIQNIQIRASAPPEYKDVSVNGVQFLRDQYGNSRPLFDRGVPDIARNQNQTVGEDNPYGVAAGTGISLSPTGSPQIVGRPPEGYEMAGGHLQARAGGPQDLGSPAQAYEQLSKARGEVQPIINQATALTRNINAVRAGLRAQDGAGDIAIVNGLQRLIDEGVVREGDVALQLSAQGLNGGVAGLRGYMNSTGKFDPAIRAQLGRVAEDIYGQQNQAYQALVTGRAAAINRTFGEGAFDDVVPPSTLRALGWEAPAPAGADPRPQSRPASSRPATHPANNGNTLSGQYTREQALAELRRRQGGR